MAGTSGELLVQPSFSKQGQLEQVDQVYVQVLNIPRDGDSIAFLVSSFQVDYSYRENFLKQNFLLNVCLFLLSLPLSVTEIVSIAFPALSMF